jgi:protein TonB
MRDEDVPARLVPSNPQERALKVGAFCVAVAIHAAALLMNLPSMTHRVPPERPHHGPIVVRKYVPPPPKIQQPLRHVQKKKNTRRIPIPDPTPDMPEPICEPELTLEPEPYPSDVGALIGTPSPPSQTGSVGGTGRGDAGPLFAGVGTTLPVRIEGSYVKPVYPELARLARVESDVILQAVIECNGSVGDVVVLRCSSIGFGFEDAAVNAVEQWRYEPARQDGRPVAVYFTILVDFSLV